MCVCVCVCVMCVSFSHLFSATKMKNWFSPLPLPVSQGHNLVAFLQFKQRTLGPSFTCVTPEVANQDSILTLIIYLKDFVPCNKSPHLWRQYECQATVNSEEVRRDTHQRIHQGKCSLFARKEPCICKNFMSKLELAKRVSRIKKL